MFDKYKYKQPKQEDEPRWKSKLKLSPKDKHIIISTEKKYTEEEKDNLRKRHQMKMKNVKISEEFRAHRT